MPSLRVKFENQRSCFSYNTNNATNRLLLIMSSIRKLSSINAMFVLMTSILPENNQKPHNFVSVKNRAFYINSIFCNTSVDLSGV